MNQIDREFENRIANRLLDVLIRAGLILALAVLCYRVFAPFLGLMIGALIMAVMLYPLQQSLARKIGGRQGLAATLLAVAGIVLIAVTAVPMIESLSKRVPQFISAVRSDELSIPAPGPSVKTWPIVGERVYGMWSMAHSDLPALVQRMQPQIGDFTKSVLRMIGGLGVDLVQFFFSFIIAAIIMAYGAAGTRGAHAIARRVVGPARGTQLIALSTATIRAVAIGVIGIAFIQATLVGIALLIAGIPWAGVLALIVLVLGVAQVPASLVILPCIAYLWMGGDYSIGESIGYTLLLAVCSSADNVLKPLLLGRGVDAPMPIILIGALGGLANSGFLGLFLGATLLALGYNLFMGWVEYDPDNEPPPTSPVIRSPI
jgi:predicted PurR-regulated permease PerM